MVFKKCKEHPEDVLFIDASQHFEKVKTQNVLREEHIDKIIDTYRNRTEDDKYSKRATLQLIADNDYNLNIPRYVDTFEAEDSIDINAIANEIKALDTKIADTNKTLADFCKQLNIVTPF
jgi:type I restriction enzyme M protein